MRVGRFIVTSGVAAILFALVACGDIYADPQGDVVPAPRPTFDGSFFPQDTPSLCPVKRPQENTLCTLVGSTCEYGTSPDLSCNDTLACVGDSFSGQSFWERRTNGSCPVEQCPGEDAGSIDGLPCNLPLGDSGPPSDADELLCQTFDGLCACTTGRDGAHTHPRRWVCVKSISQCPTDRPLAGHPCPNDLWCDYGSCKFKRGVLMQCRQNVWLTGGATCE